MHWIPCQRALALHNTHTHTHTSKYQHQNPHCFFCFFGFSTYCLGLHYVLIYFNNPPHHAPTLLCPSFRLLSQLDETERAFDEFWVRHQTKLQQCLQLRHFEHNYREVSLLALSELSRQCMYRPHDPYCNLTVVFLLQVRALLDQVSEKLATFSEVGISPAHADHIFSELSTYEERVCVSNTQSHTNKAKGFV